MMTKEQYIASLRTLHLNLYRFGEKVENVVDDPIVRPSLNSFAATYELAEDPQYDDLMTATSNLTGKKINRFTHLHQSADDLIRKVKMQRLLGQRRRHASNAAWVWTRQTLFTPRRMKPMRLAAPSTTRISRSFGRMCRKTTGRSMVR